MKPRKQSTVLEIRHLTESTAVVRFERQGLAFEPGQYIRVGLEGDPEIRDYSVYSGRNDDFLEILVKRVDDGLVSIQLTDLKPGNKVSVGGPYGHFKLIEEVLQKPLLFVASGTGISPFQSFIRSHPSLNFRLLHGIRHINETYDSTTYGNHYFSCISRDDGGDFHGRVTQYLAKLDIDPATEAFLCGNCDMIYDAFDLLQAKGLATARLHTEVYF